MSGSVASKLFRDLLPLCLTRLMLLFQQSSEGALCPKGFHWNGHRCVCVICKDKEVINLEPLGKPRCKLFQNTKLDTNFIVNIGRAISSKAISL